MFAAEIPPLKKPTALPGNIIFPTTTTHPSVSMLCRRTALQFLRSAQYSIPTRRFSTKTAESTNEYVPVSELEYPESVSSHHNDLPSFLEYASRIDLDTNSGTYVGTHYEYTVGKALESYGMQLKRIGGRSDCGIDLLGTWTVPSAAQPLKVLVQCKAHAGRKIEPSQARELEGAFVGAPPGWRGSGVLGLLVTQKSATKGVREALGRSRWPMGFVLCSADGKILQMLWNRKAEQEGLDGIGVGLKYTGGDVTEKEVVLTWKGEAIGV